MNIPYRWADLTLGDLQVLMSNAPDLEKVGHVCRLSKEEVLKMPMGTVLDALNRINHIPEVARHEQVITIEGKKYGFVKDWDEFTTGEWIDCESYQEDFWPNAHKIMAVLYRPMKYHVGKEYSLKKYTAKEDAEPFKGMPADLFSGALLFFWNTRITRLQTLQASLLEVTEGVLNSTRSGSGTPSSTRSRTTTFSRWIKSRSSRFTSYFNTSRSSKT